MLPDTMRPLGVPTGSIVADSSERAGSGQLLQSVGALASETPSSGVSVGASSSNTAAAAPSPAVKAIQDIDAHAVAAELLTKLRAEQADDSRPWALNSIELEVLVPQLAARMDALENQISGLISVVEMCVQVVTTAVDKGCICSTCSALDDIAERGAA